MEKDWFDLQLFAEGGQGAAGGEPGSNAGGEPDGSGQGAAGGEPDGSGGIPSVNTALGGDGGSGGNAGGEPGGQNVPETYDFAGAVTEVFGDEAELDADISGKFTEILKGLNATQEQAASVAKFGMEYAKNIGNEVAQQIQQSYIDEVNGWGEAAKKELGNQFDETVAQACTTRNYLEKQIPGFTKMLNQTGAGNHVAMIKAMAMMAKLVGEDPGGANGGTGGAGASTIYDKTDFSKY